MWYERLVFRVLGLMAALTHKAANPTLVTNPSAPPELLCPIGHSLMEDSVMLVETQETYDRKNIERWFRTGHRTCPLRGAQPLRDRTLVPNRAIARQLESWRSPTSTPDSPSSHSSHSQDDADTPEVDANGQSDTPEGRRRAPVL
ncbi:hypothetical protein WJX72_009188 [[Myrmecia] bisecta]|uniref:U-box domain-containing protein n=1 Tax=[Myrmecia] bisecta TaxID=41462 RepID=A0AAW1PCU7_9CHLO